MKKFDSYYINESVNYWLQTSLPECEHPILLSNGYYVPCGHCELCSTKIKKEWIIRNRLELVMQKVGCFFTLTFDNEHISNTGYKVIVDFLKRFRKFIATNIDKKVKIKYFGVYENGDTTGRGHYHILVYGVDLMSWWRRQKIGGTLNEFIWKKIWKNGFVYVELLNVRSIQYVCGYVQKKMLPKVEDMEISHLNRRKFNWVNKWVSNDKVLSAFTRTPQGEIKRQIFIFMSKGLGFTWLERNKKRIREKGYISVDGYKYSLPRIFKRKLQEWYGDKPLPYELQGIVVNEKYYEYMSKKDIDSLTFEQYEEFLYDYIKISFAQAKQKSKTLSEKRSLYERKKKKNFFQKV